ncbi:MAG: nitrite reductase [Acidobacteria bacterium]|nr:MAG: nitrite reductase [Acidobacteriota bacterium]
MIHAGKVTEFDASGCRVVQINGHTLALFRRGKEIFAVDNRCPHMGFPLHRGTVQDGILTCHWHHARFDLRSGGTFDLWADDLSTFPVEIRGDDVYVDLAPRTDPRAHDYERLRDGLERNIPLILAKSVLSLLEGGEDATVPFSRGLEFGVRNRQAGWGAGLTTLTALANLLPRLDREDQARALYHGLTAVAQEAGGAAPRFAVRPLPGASQDLPTLKRWFRQFVEVRDSEGAERAIVSAVAAGAGPREMAELLFAAATDHRYIDTGHVADFTNKALEALDRAGWGLAGPVLASLASGYTGADRMEESNSWRYPVDLVAILEKSFEALPGAIKKGRARRVARTEPDRDLVSVLLGDDAPGIAEAMLEALGAGTSETDLAGAVAYAAALRIARFHTSNEFSDWDAALHSFTFSNAIHQALGRAPTTELLRGVFDAAMTVYLNRFLNVPPARLPEAGGSYVDPQGLLAELPSLYDRQQSVEQAGEAVARFEFGRGQSERLLATLGHLLLREDRNFHTIQMVEAAFRQYRHLGNSTAGVHALVAAARYLAAHAPTVRSQEQTFLIARRLERGDRLFEES